MVILIRNVSKRVSDVDASAMVEAVHQQLAQQLAPSWGIVAPSLSYIGKAQPPSDSNVLIIDDDPPKGEDGVEGYHDLSADGCIEGFVFASPSLDNGAQVLEGANSVASVLSHETIEATLDPWANYWVDTYGHLHVKGHAYAQVALEGCDSFEADDGNNITVLGKTVTVSNFIIPGWTNPNFVGPCDYLSAKAGRTSKPFSLSENGYVIVRNAVGSETSIFGKRYPAWKKAMKLANSKSRTRRRMYGAQTQIQL